MSGTWYPTPSIGRRQWDRILRALVESDRESDTHFAGRLAVQIDQQADDLGRAVDAEWFVDYHQYRQAQIRREVGGRVRPARPQIRREVDR